MFAPKRCRFVVIFFFLFSIATFSQGIKEYSTIFGEKYSDALAYIHNNQWISDSIASHGVDPILAISIVFPELIRYSALRDLIETHSLEVLYVQYGAKYADFSIGRFQIKPSFASKLEKDWKIYITKKGKQDNQHKLFDTIDTPHSRALRLDRLKQDQWQVKYLLMFVELMSGIKHKTTEQQVEFLAAAYNIGYWHSFDEIVSIGKKNYYHTSLIKPDSCYNYADISLGFYLKQRPK